MGLYDVNYERCQCFWGTKPARMVVQASDILTAARPNSRLCAVDLGCGEGKNAGYLSSRGFSVLAIEESHAGLSNATRAWPDSGVIWLEASMLNFRSPVESIDLVIATGSLHCLDNDQDVSRVIRAMQYCTKKGGINVISAFNDRQQDFGGHPPGFSPILLSHKYFSSLYDSWSIIESSDLDLDDQHPDTEVSHMHSITRIIAIKPED